MTPAPTIRTTQPAFHLIASPLDFPFARREGVDDLNPLLDMLRGEVGLTGLAVWGAAPSARSFRARDLRPRLMQSEGGLFFESPQACGSCRAFRAADKAPPLSSIAQACARHELAVRTLLSTSRLGGLARYYPEFATRNAFDDVSTCSVCLLNPAVQECMLQIACGVPPQPVGGQIVLHDFRVAWYEAFDPAIQWPGALGSVERSMLATCFCPSCVRDAREAGIDAGQARERVQKFIDRALSQAALYGGTWTGFLDEQPAINEYLSFQAEALSGFGARIVEDCRAEVMIAYDDTWTQPPSGPIQSVATIDDLSELARRRNQTGPCEVTVPASLLTGLCGEQFVAAMSQLGEYSYRGVQIDNLGAIPEPAWKTLKQAIRFARRSVML